MISKIKCEYLFVGPTPGTGPCVLFSAVTSYENVTGWISGPLFPCQPPNFLVDDVEVKLIKVLLIIIDKCSPCLGMLDPIAHVPIETRGIVSYVSVMLPPLSPAPRYFFRNFQWKFLPF